MRTWKEVIKEATAAEIRRAGEAALRDERKKNKEEKITKGKSSYQDYLEKQLEFKKKKYEAQKAAQIERMKEKMSKDLWIKQRHHLKAFKHKRFQTKIRKARHILNLWGMWVLLLLELAVLCFTV